jgi:hypothetical protein
MPIMAEKPVGIDDDVLSPGTDSGTSILAKSALDEAPPHTTGFSEGFVASGGATQSPVLNGGEYTNYDTIFYHGSLAEPGGIVDPTLVDLETDFLDCHYINLRPGSVVPYWYTDAFLSCPFASYDSKQGGIQPRVKYLGLYYRSDLSGSGYPKVDLIHVMNGGEVIKSIVYDPPFSNNGQAYTVQVIDLGAYYRFNRGLNMAVHIKNSLPYSPAAFRIAGYGARFEW